MAMNKKKIRTSEIVAYSIFGLIWIGGLVVCCLGIYAYNGPGKLAYNPIYQAQKTLSSYLNLSSTVDFRILGSIICLIAMCFLIGFLYHFANKVDKGTSRKSKQLEKLKKLLEEEDKKANEQKVETTQVSSTSVPNSNNQ